MSIHEYGGDNPFVLDVEKTCKIVYEGDPSQERSIVVRDYHALALEWAKYARGAESVER